MKKKIVSLCLCVALLAVAVGGTLAYFTDTTEAKENVFTVGNINIILTETEWDKEEHEDVYPGEALAKNPVVANLSDDGNTISPNPCFVRVKVEGLDQFGDDNMITYETDNTTGKLGENWVDGGDGYFYYMKPLAGQYQAQNEGMAYQTTALFEKIRMPVGLEGGEEAKPVVVSAEAVQAQGAKPSWSAVQSISLTDLQAWFTTCMG